jgi:hypothetical protein
VLFLNLLVLLGAAVTCWSLWMSRNNPIFENKQISFLHVIFIVSHWLHPWAILHKPTQGLVAVASQRLIQMAKEFFT